MTHSLSRLAPIAALAALLAAGPALANPNDAAEVDTLATRGTLTGNYLAGRVAGASRDAGAAATFFRAALKSDPRNAELLERTFLLTLADGDGDGAMRLAERVVATDPSNRIARLALAARSIRTHNYGAARHHLSRGAKGPLADLTTQLLIGWTWLGSDQPAKAVEAVDKLQGADFFGTFRDYHAALIADIGNRKDEAAKRFNAALSGDGSALRIAQAAAIYRARAGDKAGALKALADFEKASPRHPLIRETRDAIEQGKEAKRIVKDPTDGAAEVLYGIGGALGRQGGEDLSIVYLQLALYLEPEHPMALVTLADLYDQLNQYADAIDVYDRVPESSALKRNADIQSAMDLDRLDKTDKAKAQLKKLIDADPTDQEAIVALGNIERGREQFKEAADTYSKAVDLVEKRQAAEAAASPAQPADVKPAQSAAAAASPDRSNWSLYYVRGIAYERSKQWAKAEADLKKALELSPDQALVMNYLGYSWIDQGVNLDEGMKLIRKAVELKPDDGYIVDSLGWAFYKLGKYEDAVRELERAVELRPQDPVMNDHLGDAYWRVGRKLEARFQWSHALELKPEANELPKIEAKLKDGLEADKKTDAAEVKEKREGG
ncbi:tetratricopeptide repeat protein [Chenggangzhangella methanolivorans]|uniref:Tetratricopeptide repeat protein n=1 Tax=Chenggangzhangella methanolivorans TaxID=1437009 RepID=A0A9E6RBQ6_9HYPH|nr:tetratricopeptide repeat protein [Chenggangzhangella methanolivorans]QZO01302.1 tetratricopeptide repeat protein [Chenggangzhangella methanolivorans]